MRRALISIRDRLDRAGVLLSGLCAVHCLAGLLLVSLLGFGGELLLAPAIHEVGLALAIVVGVFTLGLGVLRHGDPAPLAVGAAGIVLMACALVVGHGPREALLTIAGGSRLAVAPIRHSRRAA